MLENITIEILHDMKYKDVLVVIEQACKAIVEEGQCPVCKQWAGWVDADGNYLEDEISQSVKVQHRSDCCIAPLLPLIHG